MLNQGLVESRIKPKIRAGVNGPIEYRDLVIDWSIVGGIADDLKEGYAYVVL